MTIRRISFDGEYDWPIQSINPNTRGWPELEQSSIQTSKHPDEFINRKSFRFFSKGLLGAEKLFRYLMRTWSEDVKNNQLSSVLGSVGPMKAIVTMLNGILDLFKLPFEQYRKDGRLIRGLQLGVLSFGTHTVLSVLEITTRLIQMLQVH